MSEVRSHLKYISSHEWIRVDSDTIAVVGITDHAQQSLGDVVYVEMPEVGLAVKAGEEVGVVESVKAASDIYAPLSGKIVEVNTALEETPEQVNQSPYDDGWFFKIEVADISELEAALDDDGYRKLIAESGE